MFLSIFDIFKIGLGPSSSHTMGPMIAAHRFLDALRTHERCGEVQRLRVRLYGSLAFTGKGHGTDRAVKLGLLGYEPSRLDTDEAEIRLAALERDRRLRPAGLPEVAFDPVIDLIFDYGPPLPGHPNGMMFVALADGDVPLFTEVYYSVGGGFVVTAAEQNSPLAVSHATGACPFPFATAASMLRMAKSSGLSISEMKRRNEEMTRAPEEVRKSIELIWSAMSGCIDRGLATDGVLPGGLNVSRRAPRMYEQMLDEQRLNRRQPHTSTDWLYLYAMAVNEENAAGGRVVTAPTNGAAGVVPAVLRYYLEHCVGAELVRVQDFLLTAAAIGGLIKHNASISGAEAGCQGEVGSAAAMAAAGLCEVLGGTPAQVENAAEIALEHHLGMTCDPVAGLVQVPCIERNGLGAVKAVTAASMALRGDGSHFMPLDNCIAAMRETGEAMSTKLKETSLGGLAVNLPEC